MILTMFSLKTIVLRLCQLGLGVSVRVLTKVKDLAIESVKLWLSATLLLNETSLFTRSLIVGASVMDLVNVISREIESVIACVSARLLVSVAILAAESDRAGFSVRVLIN